MKPILSILFLLFLNLSVFSQSDQAIKTSVSIKNTYSGLYDLKGKQVLAPKYGSIDYFAGDLFLVKEWDAKQIKEGIISSEGKIIIPMGYNSIRNFANRYIIVSEYEFTEDGERSETSDIYDFSGIKVVSNLKSAYSYGEYCFVKNNEDRVAVYNDDLKIIIPFEKGYSEIYYLRDQLFSVRVEGKFGIIDIKQNLIQPFIYDNVSQYRFRDKDKSVSPVNYIIVRNGSMYGVLDVEGKELIPTKYYSISCVTFDWVEVQEKDDCKSVGLIDIHHPEEFLIPCAYSSFDYCDGYVLAYKKVDCRDENPDVVIFNNKGKLLFTYSGSIELMGLNCWKVVPVYENGLYSGVVNDDKDVILPTIYDDIRRLTDSLLLVKKKAKSEIVNMKGELVLSLDNNLFELSTYWSWLRVIKEDMTEFYKIEGESLKLMMTKNAHGKWHFYLPDNSIKEYADVDNGSLKDEYIVVDGYKYGIIDSSGNEIIPTKYRMIESGLGSGQYNICDADNKWFQYVKEGGRYVRSKELKYKYYNQLDKDKRKWKYVYPISDDLCEVEFKDGKMGLVDLNLKLKTRQAFDYIKNLDHNLFRVVKNDKVGIIDGKGKEIVPVKYKDAYLQSLGGKVYIKVYK